MKGLRITIKPSARRVIDRIGDTKPLQRQRIHIGCMPSAMLDKNWMMWSNQVQVFAGKEAALYCLGIIILEAMNPFTNRCHFHPITDCCLDGGDSS
jgi:hypothetical protein